MADAKYPWELYGKPDNTDGCGLSPGDTVRVANVDHKCMVSAMKGQTFWVAAVTRDHEGLFCPKCNARIALPGELVAWREHQHNGETIYQGIPVSYLEPIAMPDAGSG